ncbi:hypothetical protein [Caulobacter mirabilis]|uniref:hypothetical protein n=1 Tax=Caulobacter mirabilis TaxID=69666 RepID=UPI00123790A1|nr:hypothetical protein [Caulobacter mirabilis]
MSLAIQRFDSSRPGPLAALLTADDPVVRRRGLFVFGALGRKAEGLLDQALQSVDHPDEAARSALMDGVISHSNALSAEQVGAVLGLANDPSDLVRSKVVAFLRESSADVLRAAITAHVPEGLVEEHLKGLELLASSDRGAQSLFDEGVSAEGLRSTYALAAVERMAKNGLIDIAPDAHGVSWIGEATHAQIIRLMNRRRSFSS